MILAALATPADVQDNQPALDLLWRTRFRWKLRPRQVTGDTKYGTVANIVAIERDHVRADVPLSAVGHRPGLFADTAVVDAQAACTTARRGRRVGRRLDELFLERVRDDHATEACAKAMRKPLIAEAKERHGLRRVRLRGAEKVTIQAQLIAAGQNLQRLVSNHGWGRRPWPCGAAGSVLPAAISVTVVGQ